MTEVTISTLPPAIIPSEWNELTREQLLFVCTKLNAYQTADESLKAELKADIAFHLIDLPLAEHTEYVAEQVRTLLLPTIDFLFEPSQLTEQLLPKIKIRKHITAHFLYGPASNFNNLTFEEFDDAEYWLEQMKTESATEHALNMFCAILYREFAESKGDTRIPYSAHDNEERAKWFAYCEPEVRLAILLWYTGCRAQLVNNFEDLFKAAPTDNSAPGGWTIIAHSLAGPVLGTIDDVLKRPVRQVFTEMQRLFKNAQELEAMREK